ncbi:group 2 allergen Sui m 2-like protein, partial [Dinothrombium tinctorium]
LGSGEIKSVDVTPCDSDPCSFRKGQTVTVTGKFVANRNTPTAVLKATVDVGGIPLEYPGIDPNACNSLPCPLQKGREYSMTLRVKSEKYFPTVGIVLKHKIFIIFKFLDVH